MGLQDHKKKFSKLGTRFILEPPIIIISTDVLAGETVVRDYVNYLCGTFKIFP